MPCWACSELFVLCFVLLVLVPGMGTARGTQNSTIKHLHVPPQAGWREFLLSHGDKKLSAEFWNKPEVATRVLQAEISLTQQISEQFQLLLLVELGLGEMRMGCRRRSREAVPPGISP